MKTTFIYVLCDPKGNIRYVGKTSYPKQRLYSHIKESLTTTRHYHKTNWIKSLLLENQRPTIEVVDEVLESEWEFWESWWISFFKGCACDLTNLTNGGGGGNGYTHSEESKCKMRDSKLGNKLSVEHKNKISSSIKEVYKSSEYRIKKFKKRISISRDELYDIYINKNMSIPYCSLHFGCSEKTIFNNLKDFNIIKPVENWKEQLSNPKLTIIQYDLSGKFIRKWNGSGDIERKTGLKSSLIISCCRGRTNNSQGYIWRIEGDPVFREVEMKKDPKKVAQILNGETVCTFDSISEASRETSISRTSISYCCKDKLKSAGGFQWKFI